MKKLFRQAFLMFLLFFTMNVEIWAKEATAKEGNVFLREVGVSQDMVEEEVRIPMQLESVLGTKTLHLAGTIYKPESGDNFPLLILNHGTPRTAEERKKSTKMRDQSNFFVQKGFVVVPMRRGHGTSEGEYAEDVEKCSQVDYDLIAQEAVKYLKATVAFMTRKPYVDIDKKILMAGQSSGGFASLAYASVYPEELMAVINFAGGKGPIKP